MVPYDISADSVSSQVSLHELHPTDLESTCCLDPVTCHNWHIQVACSYMVMVSIRSSPSIQHIEEHEINPWLAADVICRLPYADSVAPDQPAHPRSLI